MAIKKSELYSSLWKSCDELRGGMDASQYKDYALVLLFVKYVSDKYAGRPNALIVVPPGGSFADMVAARGQKDIGDRINKIKAALAEANHLTGVITVADFNDPDKLGKGKEMQDRLSNLVGIFENPALDFRRNRAEGDDLLGDAYEYLMRNFATESGKSKAREYVSGESHYYQGHRYLLNVVYRKGTPAIIIRSNKIMDLFARPDSDTAQRERVLTIWYRRRLKEEIAPLIAKWEAIIDVQVAAWGVKQMKTRWGTCNIEARRIWLNLELIKKPVHCLEYIIVHEMVHLLEHHHNERFIAHMNTFMPLWQFYREELNREPLGHETWEY